MAEEGETALREEGEGEVAPEEPQKDDIAQPSGGGEVTEGGGDGGGEGAESADESREGGDPVEGAESADVKREEGGPVPDEGESAEGQLKSEEQQPDDQESEKKEGGNGEGGNEEGGDGEGGNEEGGDGEGDNEEGGDGEGGEEGGGQKVVEGDEQKAVDGGGEIAVEAGREEIQAEKEAEELQGEEGESVQREEVAEPGQTGLTEVKTEEELAATETSPGEGDVPSRLQSAVQPTPLEDIVEEEEEEIDREAVIRELQENLAVQEKLRGVNAQLQHKIAEYLARKKTEDKLDPGRNVTDQEKRYVQCMAGLDSLRQELLDMQEAFGREEQELRVLREQKLSEVDQAVAELAAYRRQYAVTAVSSRTGRRLAGQEVDQYQAAEARKELDVIQVRLENVKLQNRIQKLETLIKQKDQLAEGLHMIDFEQLKINNVDLNEKIEDRNEDIMKLKRKVTATVQVLTHVKEKLQFLQAENSEKKAALQEVEALVATKRDHLTRMKQARDALRMDNIRLRQKGGLVSHSALLRDFEERVDQGEEMRSHLEVLQQRHSELTVLCDGVKRRIDQTRTLHPHM